MRALVLCLPLLAAPLCADPADRVEAAFDSWLRQHDIGDGALVLLKDGAPLRAVAHGLSPDRATDLQSTSKAITAHCVKSLVDAGALDWTTPLHRVIDTPSDLTIAELVTHTSGLTRDSTQGDMAAWRNDPTPRWTEVTQRALARTAAGTRGAYAYNNENYAILGTVIETITGQPYDETCKTRVLSDAPSARLSPVTGSYGPWGGWQMSPAEYARFHFRHFGALDPAALPHADLGHGAFYGLGTIWRHARGGGFNHWHFGLLCFHDGQANGGSFAVSWAGGYTVFAAYNACIDSKAMAGLDRSMIEALFSP